MIKLQCVRNKARNLLVNRVFDFTRNHVEPHAWDQAWKYIRNHVRRDIENSIKGNALRDYLK